MPELPEVETVKNGLKPQIQELRVEKVVLRRAALRYPFPEGFAQALEGQICQNIDRRAKFLIFDFGGHGFLGHLGMSGSYRIAPRGEPFRKHDHFALYFGEEVLIYHDPRRFGAVDLWQGAPHAHKWLSRLGPEPLGNAFSPQYLHKALHARKSPIKSALLDQALVAGLGNIYVCEALFMSKISPTRMANELSQLEIFALTKAIREALRAAIASGGSSLRDFVRPSGELGYFQHQFQVYGQEGKACGRCSEGIIRISQSGRSSFYCPNCQQ